MFFVSICCAFAKRFQFCATYRLLVGRKTETLTLITYITKYSKLKFSSLISFLPLATLAYNCITVCDYFRDQSNQSAVFIGHLPPVAPALPASCIAQRKLNASGFKGYS